MNQPAENQTQALVQLRMGLLGTLTAVLACFAAAYAFSGTVTQATEVEAASSTD